MFINLIFVIACVSHYCSHFVCVWHMCLNTLKIANLSVLFSALSIVYVHSIAVHFRRSCSSEAHSRFIVSCVGVNAAIYIRAVRESTFKQSAFDLPHRNKLCR